jgi:SAM-dependent methyltransferase
MSTSERGIYADGTFRDTDIGAIMREGHPDITEGDQQIIRIVGQLRASLDRPLRILDVGSGSGHLSQLVARELPDCEVIANEIEATPLAQARAKLSPLRNARTFDRPFREWTEPVDVVISWGTHHHLGHDYLDHVREILAPDGLFLIGDEFCPEYLTPSDQDRLRSADRIALEDGYLFDNEQELQEYRQRGVVPQWSLDAERNRRRALWTWYKFVGDYAVAKDAWTVLITELQIARDDLITNFAGEHKTSPFLLERELAQNRFDVLRCLPIGSRPPKLQSFVLFVCRPTGNSSDARSSARD